MTTKETIYRLEIQIAGELIRDCNTELRIQRLYFVKHTDLLNMEIINIFKQAIKKLYKIDCITISMEQSEYMLTGCTHLGSWRYVNSFMSKTYKGSHYNGNRYNFDNSPEYDLKDITDRIKAMNENIYILYLDAVRATAAQ